MNLSKEQQDAIVYLRKKNQTVIKLIFSQVEDFILEFGSEEISEEGFSHFGLLQDMREFRNILVKLSIEEGGEA